MQNHLRRVLYRIWKKTQARFHLWHAYWTVGVAVTVRIHIRIVPDTITITINRLTVIVREHITVVTNAITIRVHGLSNIQWERIFVIYNAIIIIVVIDIVIDAITIAIGIPT
jgi:hypothetical protein